MADRPLVEGDDYYLEGGLVVFTAAYHRRRGYCCGSRCRHCPYPKAVQDATTEHRSSGHPVTSIADMRKAVEAAVLRRAPGSGS